MVDSSSPAITGAGGGGGGGATAAVAEFRSALRSTIHVKHEMQIEHTMAGMTIDNAMILKICRPRDLPVD